MEIHHLKIFVSVYKLRSFTKASEILFISQPTISEHIKNFEAELNCHLFDRLGRTIMPTRQAEFLYPRALKIIAEVEKLHEDLAVSGKQIKGELVIGASTIPGTYILPIISMKFKQIHPEVSFEIRIGDSGKITDMVLNHELLCGIVGARMESKKLAYLPFFNDELVLVASENAVPGRLAEPSDIYALPFLSREIGSGTRKIMEDFLIRTGIDPKRLDIVATLGSTAAVKEALKAGLGISILSRLAVRDELAAGKLKEIPIPDLKMRRDFYLIGHKKRTWPPLYEEFSRFLQESAGRDI